MAKRDDGPAIRAATEADLAVLPAIEASGDAGFRALGMGLVADAVPAPAGVYAAALADGWVLVAVDGRDVPVGFVRVELVDGNPHVEQVSVVPAAAGRGIGAALLTAVADLARTRGYGRMTLRTFRDVPFNGPYYVRLGWRVLPEAEVGPQLRALRDAEERQGLLAWPRQAMVHDL